jgi:hypothetical protein
MADRISRRKFTEVVGNTLLVSACDALASCAEKPQSVAPVSSKTAPIAPKGKLSMTNGKVDLRVPAGAPAEETWRYGLTFPFQLAPRTAAAFCNIRASGDMILKSERTSSYSMTLPRSGRNRRSHCHATTKRITRTAIRRESRPLWSSIRSEEDLFLWVQS